MVLAMVDASPPETPPPPNAAALNIVLFGRPAAGKTSLLGALSEAVHAQPELLHGRLTDLSHHLDDLRSTLYAGGPPQTEEEVVPYPVDFEPFTDGDATPARQVPAILIDSDGHAANVLLHKPEEMEEAAEKALARELARADTLVLVIDASAAPEQIEESFQEFDLFLQQMEQKRGRRVEVGGLPVFLVLTKCDLLAQPGDRFADWMERVEARKREVHERFRAFIEREHPAAGAVFGRIDLRLWATAIQRPAFPGVARPREPYGVAELFRQALEEADVFRGRRGRAERRLTWTVRGAVGAVAVLTALVTGQIVLNWNLPPTPRGIESEPEYRAYLARIEEAPTPDSLDTVKGLDELEGRLKGELALPSPSWSGTKAGGLYLDLVQRTEALRTGVADAVKVAQAAGQQANQLRTFHDFDLADIDWQRWSDSVEEFLAKNKPLLLSDAELIPDSATGLAGGEVKHFQEVKEADKNWQVDRNRLRQVFDVLSALGLATPSNDRPAVLKLPREPTLEQVGQRRQELERAYPRFAEEFLLDRLPEAVRPKVRQAARTNYDYLLQPGQAEVLRQLQKAGTGTEETAQRWQAVREWLDKPEELAAWRVLAGVLLRLSDPAAPDPVQALQSFLGQSTFTLTFHRILLDIPDTLETRPGADAPFEIYHQQTAADRPAMSLAPVGESEHIAAARANRYTFALMAPQRLTFRPGDRLWASLRMREDHTLSWTRERSARYRLECLRRPPRLHRTGEQPTEGSLQGSIRLTLDPVDGVPRVPDLLPVVRLEAR
jgi:hypothetical protein